MLKCFIVQISNNPAKFLTSLRAAAVLSRHFNLFRRWSHDDCKSEKLLKAFRNCLYKRLKKQDVQTGNKVSIVGAGSVGMGCAISLLSKGITNNLAIYDFNTELCSAEALDLLHGSLFLNNCSVEQSCEVECTKNSRVVVVTCGEHVKANETRLDAAQKTADVIIPVVRDLFKCSPKAIFIVVSNPVDVMTWLTRQITGLPYERCFSTGCHLDTARFRMFIAKKLGVSTSSVQGYVLGEHGSTSVPLWSGVSVGGVRLMSLVPEIGTKRDPMKWSEVHKEVVDAACKVIAGKGYTNWAIGLTVADVVSAIFENSNRVLSLSTNAKGFCGITDEIFLSLPCIVNKSGLHGIIRPGLSKWEKAAMNKSAEDLLKAQCSIKF